MRASGGARVLWGSGTGGLHMVSVRALALIKPGVFPSEARGTEMTAARIQPEPTPSDGPATGSAAPLIAAASSVAIGAARVKLLLHRARARVERAPPRPVATPPVAPITQNA
jgi:hypothetical protein